jgi:hypothetical protein
MIFKDVLFEFYGMVSRKWVTAESEMGPMTVSEDGTQMTLQVECPGDLPYLIKGRKLPSGKFSGRHVGKPSDVEVLASWGKVAGGRYEGMRREIPADYDVLQFTFRLQQP